MHQQIRPGPSIPNRFRTRPALKVEIMGAALQGAEARSQPLPEDEASLMPSMIENSDNDSATTLLSDVGGATALAQFDRSMV